MILRAGKRKNVIAVEGRVLAILSSPTDAFNNIPSLKDIYTEILNSISFTFGIIQACCFPLLWYTFESN